MQSVYNNCVLVNLISFFKLYVYNFLEMYITIYF